MKKILITAFVLVFSMTTYANCLQPIFIQNKTGSPDKPGVPLTLQVKSGNVTWNPNLSGKVLNQFGSVESGLSYASGKSVDTRLDVYNDKGALVCSVFSSLKNGCDIVWGSGCTSPFRVEMLQDKTGKWIFTYYGY